ncbi:unnamed protein product, partial [Nesidiocoris tenuis]
MGRKKTGVLGWRRWKLCGMLWNEAPRLMRKLGGTFGQVIACSGWGGHPVGSSRQGISPVAILVVEVEAVVRQITKFMGISSYALPPDGCS